MSHSDALLRRCSPRPAIAPTSCRPGSITSTWNEHTALFQSRHEFVLVGDLDVVESGLVRDRLEKHTLSTDRLEGLLIRESVAIPTALGMHVLRGLLGDASLLDSPIISIMSFH